MNQTEQTLLEQMRITEFDVAYRKELLALSDADFKLLKSYRPILEARIDVLVGKFYQLQTSVAEISLLIGDADTLTRLRSAQRKYVLDLFSGVYDLEYVNNRLRIGLVHKRIGVEPKLYLSAVSTLKTLLYEVIADTLVANESMALMAALDKLFLFDITLVFETYIRSLVTEIEISKEKSDRYALVLEDKVHERTLQLEELARVDPLTGLLSVRYLYENLTRTLRAAERRSEFVSVVYFDVDNFKAINDTKGHLYGDVVLRGLGAALLHVSRVEDSCFRYGGDEFFVILPNCQQEKAREIYLIRLNEEVELRLPGLTLSIGIAETGPYEFSEPETLIRISDDLMYAAKKAKKALLDNDNEATLV
jgi:diguanylate cyclase (GGDEF)-like protein